MRLRDLLDDVWCTACQHIHIPEIPATTFACSECGFGCWEVDYAAIHATRYPDHIVHPIHHTTVSLAERPTT